MKPEVYVVDLIKEIKENLEKGTLVRLIPEEGFKPYEPPYVHHQLEKHLSLEGILCYFDGDEIGNEERAKKDLVVDLREKKIIYKKILISLESIIEEAIKYARDRNKIVNILTDNPSREDFLILAEAFEKVKIGYLVNSVAIQKDKDYYTIHLSQIKLFKEPPKIY